MAAALFPFDVAISHWAVGLKLSGDMKDELRTLQQYGQLGTSLVITAAILLQWPEHRRRLLDWWLALVLTFLFCQALKMTFGRVRPGNFNEGQFTLPWQSTLVEKLAREPVRAWDLLHRDASDLWSMPSSHAAAAVVLSVFLATVFPRLTPLVIVLAGLVGAARVIFEDHFPSDVVVGLALGYLIASSIMRNEVGQRLVFRKAAAAPVQAQPRAERLNV